MDLEFLNVVEAAEKGIDFKVKNAVTGEETDIIISVAGIGSKQHKAAVREYKAELDSFSKKRDEGTLTEEESEEEKIVWANFAAACTRGWKNVTVKGEPLEFTRETAAVVYGNCMWTEQVVEQITNLKDMLGKPKSSSKSSAK